LVERRSHIDLGFDGLALATERVESRGFAAVAHQITEALLQSRLDQSAHRLATGDAAFLRVGVRSSNGCDGDPAGSCSPWLHGLAGAARLSRFIHERPARP